ncbi:PREDICTED: coiled-coil domain-containing protein 42 homolog [Amphimedon queenslandica]|uniref:DUF4200 domain-containing protein n=1 Tax=Amphimedon queenslandica TaxID=400682 RepID=A0A1X7V8E3_AMPQE|nr:PREDICTED: coiled-coil domain-containing protein 42 homolog [Amphimedon queenslandica]|eukprot:XP_019850090.1 PREDICTED: coiled-coil domain-containing protein 42 homolog [Amphimedon queenslandica]
MARAGDMDDYFKTTFEDKLLVKMPDRNSDHLTPATKLLEKRRETAEVEQALGTQKEEFSMKMEALQQRRDELERKEVKLKEQLFRFDAFVKESDLKRSRALKKTKGEQDLCKQKDKDIQRLQEEILKLSEVVNNQQAQISKYTLYQKFMDRVLEFTPEFDESREIITRYEALRQTRDDLLKTEITNQDTIESERAKLAKFIEDMNNEILHCNNELARLQTKLEDGENEAMKWDSEWTRIQTTAAKKTLLLGQIKMATHNLYVLVYKHLKKKIPPQESGETLLQLDKIQSFVKDLTEIVHEIKRHESASAPNMQLLASPRYN